MSKYIDAEKIYAEIERLISISKVENGFPIGYVWKNEAYKELLSFLDTLQQEQPEVDLEKELEEEIERFYRTDEYRIADALGRGFETLARHFAEWMKAKMLGKSYLATISANNTIPVLPMKDVSDLGFDYGDKVRVIVIKEDK